MENHRYGFVLDNNGIIGQQGSPTTPADNRWLGTWSPTGTANGNFKNACMNGSTTINSIMYTRAATIYTPNGSGYNNILGDWSYTATLIPISLYHISAPFFTGCPNTTVPMPVSTASATASYLPVETAQLVTTGTPVQQVVAQNQVYRIEESALGATLLSSFSAEESNNNIATLWNVEKLVLAENIALATSENETVQPQNTLEEAYKLYYQLLIKSKTQVLSASDSLELISLAQGCPAVIGASVYQAATLYNLIYQRAEVFEQNCNSAYGRATQQEELSGNTVLSNSLFTLYPVPNKGTFTIQGELYQGDHIGVFNLDGKEVYSQQINVDGNLLEVQTQLVSGVYIIRVTDESGKLKYHNKIVITN